MKRQSKVMDIALTDLELATHSPRRTFEPQYIRDLADSIFIDGQIKPVIVQFKPGVRARYPVIDGEHRIRALQLLQYPTASAEVVQCTDQEALILAWQANELHGRRLEPLEEAYHIRKVMANAAYTQSQVAKRFKKSQEWVSQRLALLDSLTPKVHNMIISRLIKTSVAQELAHLPPPLQDKALQKVEKEKLSKRKTRVLASALRSKPDEANEILAKPVAMWGELVKTEKELRRAIEMAPSQAPIESVPCPHCGKPLWINWVEYKVSARQVEGA